MILWATSLCIGIADVYFSYMGLACAAVLPIRYVVAQIVTNIYFDLSGLAINLVAIIKEKLKAD